MDFKTEVCGNLPQNGIKKSGLLSRFFLYRLIRITEQWI